MYNQHELGVELILNNATVEYKGYTIKRNLEKKAFEVKKGKLVKYFIYTKDILNFIEENDMKVKVSILKERFVGNHSYYLTIKTDETGESIFAMSSIWTKKDLIKVLKEKIKVTEEYLNQLDFRKTFLEFTAELR
ncbi:hypothetical protein [Cetobacterium sp.]|uniref:hypothetical protein n=1 Tax=Cetobacterium sp. TaxID=2071632 RepID=UPI003F35371C